MYVARHTQEDAEKYDYSSPLPLALSVVGSAPAAGQSFSMCVHVLHSIHGPGKQGEWQY